MKEGRIEGVSPSRLTKYETCEQEALAPGGDAGRGVGEDMIRVILAATLSLVILGGMNLFMRHRERAADTDVVAREATQAVGKFSLDVTLSFSPAASDPFAVATDEAEKKPALLVQLNGREVLRVADAVPAGDLIAREDVSGIVEGENEVLVEADPPLEDANRAHAVRVRVLRDGQPIAEQTSWSEPGARLIARMRLNVPPASSKSGARHD